MFLFYYFFVISLKFFLDLLYWSMEQSASEGRSIDHTSSSDSPSLWTQQEEEEGSLFCAAILAFSSLEQDMEKTLVEEVVGVARTNVVKYKAEK